MSIPSQTIRIDDDSGGIARDDLKLIVRPGASATLETAATIGIFGVGSKRSVIALARDIRISTTIPRQSTYRVEYGDEWLTTDTWEVPCFEVPPEAPGHTIVDLGRPRHPLSETVINSLVHHLGAVYARFLEDERLTSR